MSSTLKINNIQKIDGTPIVENGVITAAAQPGTILECLSSQCDGSTITVRSGTYATTNVTTQLRPVPVSYGDAPGSRISYMPPPGTKRVIYQYDYSVDAQDSHSIGHFKLNIDGVDVVYSRNTWDVNATTHFEWLQTFRWTINCDAAADDPNTGSFTEWTSPKELVYLCRSYAAANEIALFGTTYWDGAGGDVFKQPTLTITAIA